MESARAGREAPTAHDPVTGLADRTLFERRVEEKLSGRRSRGGSTAVLLLDLDGFEDITREHGRAVGDDVLGQVATRLVACVRTEDAVARIGKDEFAIVLDETGAPGAAAVAQRILRALDAPIVVSDRSIGVGTRIGIAVVHVDPPGMVTAADTRRSARP